MAGGAHLEPNLVDSNDSANTVLRLRHPSGLTLDVMPYGATLLSCKVPLTDGTLREVMLGHPHTEQYRQHNSYMGAAVGRYANRIANAHYSVDGLPTSLSPSSPSTHCLHGGPDGFHRRVWQVSAKTNIRLALSLCSPDGDQGFPGTLQVSLTIQLGEKSIDLDYCATTTKACPVSLTHHPYFNLDAVHGDVRQHSLQIHAAHYLPTDVEHIPLGHFETVAGTPFDFRRAKKIGSDWMTDPQQQLVGGFDHAFLLGSPFSSAAGPAATLSSTDGRLQLHIFTTLPALQLYSGQYLAGLPGRVGRDECIYHAYDGVAIEPEFLPDHPNHPEWQQPSCWLLPETTYRQRIAYAFDAT
jgi:aldose 1-epimerase